MVVQEAVQAVLRLFPCKGAHAIVFPPIRVAASGYISISEYTVVITVQIGIHLTISENASGQRGGEEIH